MSIKHLRKISKTLIVRLSFLPVTFEKGIDVHFSKRFCQQSRCRDRLGTNSRALKAGVTDRSCEKQGARGDDSSSNTGQPGHAP